MLTALSKAVGCLPSPPETQRFKRCGWARGRIAGSYRVGIDLAPRHL